jgi:hypothetical protein
VHSSVEPYGREHAQDHQPRAEVLEHRLREEERVPASVSGCCSTAFPGTSRSEGKQRGGTRTLSSGLSGPVWSSSMAHVAV